MAVVASRSSLVGALLRTAAPAYRHAVYSFLRGLSRDELECLADFQGACVIEADNSGTSHPYRLMPDFFDPLVSDRWQNPVDRAHKTFIVLEYLGHLEASEAVNISPLKLAS